MLISRSSSPSATCSSYSIEEIHQTSVFVDNGYEKLNSRPTLPLKIFTIYHPRAITGATTTINALQQRLEISTSLVLHRTHGTTFFPTANKIPHARLPPCSLHGLISSYDGRSPTTETYASRLPRSSTFLLPFTLSNHLLEHIPYRCLSSSATTAAAVSQQYANKCLHLETNAFTEYLLHNSQQRQRPCSFPTSFSRSATFDFFEIGWPTSGLCGVDAKTEGDGLV